jgi:Family of unknown function (DUF6252)
MPPLTRRVAVSLLALCLACGDSAGPAVSTLAFDAQLDNQPWRADTAVAIAFGAPTDTTLAVAGSRLLSPTEAQEITLSLPDFRGPGRFALADSTGPGVAAFSISQISGGVVLATQVYHSQAASPGYVLVTSLNRQDSTVAGTFAFEAALIPDTATHRHVSGSFRLRLGFVPVFTVP